MAADRTLRELLLLNTGNAVPGHDVSASSLLSSLRKKTNQGKGRDMMDQSSGRVPMTVIIECPHCEESIEVESNAIKLDSSLVCHACRKTFKCRSKVLFQALFGLMK